MQPAWNEDKQADDFYYADDEILFCSDIVMCNA